MSAPLTWMIVTMMQTAQILLEASHARAGRGTQGMEPVAPVY